MSFDRASLMCFIFTIPVHFNLSAAKVSNCIFFLFLHFFFHIILYSFEETPSSQPPPSPVAMPIKGINTENSVIRRSNSKGWKPLSWISVNLGDTFNTQMNQDKQSFCVTPGQKRWKRSPGQKRYGPTSYFLYGVFDPGWYNFQLKYWWLYFGFCKFQGPDSAWRDIWWHQNYHISCCNHWKIRGNKAP